MARGVAGQTPCSADKFDGTRAGRRIDWARRRSTRCWVYSEELADVVLLPPY